MKFLFNVGCLEDKQNDCKNNIKNVYFLSLGNTLLPNISESLNNISNIFNKYDVKLVKKINNREIYCIYDTNLDYKKIKKEIINILSGNVESIINSEEVFFNENVLFYNNGTIFWDIINNIIILVGKDSLLSLSYSIEQKYWGKFINNHSFEEYVDETEFSKVYKFAKKINHNKL